MTQNKTVRVASFAIVMALGFAAPQEHRAWTAVALAVGLFVGWLVFAHDERSSADRHET